MRILSLAAIVTILAGCAGAGGSLTFKAPARFGDAKNALGFMSIWTEPSGKEVLMLMKFPGNIDFKTAMQSSPNTKDAKIERRETIKICGGQPALHLVMSKPTTHQQIDTITTTVGGSAYFAMYGYPDGTKPDPQAEASIRELCAKG